MFIRLFIKTIDNKKSARIVKDILSYIDKDNIKYVDIKTEPYWKSDDITVAEIKLELDEPLDVKQKEEFLDNISNKWLYMGEEEVLSSETMNDCRLNFDLEMINVLFS